MLLVPFIAFTAGFGWAGFGTAIAGQVNSIDNFSYITSMVLTPLFLVAGTFFPIDGLPEWAQVAANFNPLYHCVELVRQASFGIDPGSFALHYLAILFFGLVTWRLAINRMTRKLVT